MTVHIALPEGFAALSPYAERWAVTGSAERAALRGDSTPKERADFYAAASGRLADALDYLDGKGFAGFDEGDARLMNLMLSLGHVALAVEQQKDAERRHALDRQHMRITRTPAGV